MSTVNLPTTPAEVTDEFLKGKVATYLRHDAAGCGCRMLLREFLGMAQDEYASWFLTGQVPARVARTWCLRRAA